MPFRNALEGFDGPAWRTIGLVCLAALLALPVFAQEPGQDPPEQQPAPEHAQEPLPEPGTQPEPARTIPLGPAERDAIAKLQSAKPAVRREGVEKLGELRSRGASGEVAKLVASDPDPSVRRAAAVSLGRIRDEARIPDLTAALADPDPGVRLGVVQGLVNLYIDREEGVFTRVRSTLVAVVPFWDEDRSETVEPYDMVDERVTSALAEALRRDGDAKVRVACVRALGALRAESQLDALADAMAADEKLRFDALDAMVRIGSADGAGYAIPFFEHPDEKLAAQAMLTAGRLRASQSVVPLLNVYNGKDDKTSVVEKVKRTVTFAPERRKVSIQALALVGDARAEKVFYDNMYDKDAEVRRAAYEGLARQADPRFYDVVTRNKLLEKDEAVKLAQMFAIYKMGHPEVFHHLVNALATRSGREQGYQYVLEADSPEHLLPYTRMRDKQVQLMIVEALGRIGDERTIAELEPLRRGFAPEIGEAATRAIRRIEWRVAREGQTPSVARPRRVGEP
jgi:HEAT repeat protein